MSTTKNKVPPPQAVTTAELKTLTGFTDRWIRSLESDGLIPKGDRGVFPMMETLTALFAYVRSKEKSSFDQQKKEQEVIKLKLLNARLSEKLIQLSYVQSRHSALGSRVGSILRQKLEVEYPNAAAGLDVRGARVYGKRLFDQIMIEFQNLADEWTRTKPTKLIPAKSKPAPSKKKASRKTGAKRSAKRTGAASTNSQRQK